MIEQFTYRSDELPPELKCQILSFLRVAWPEDFSGTLRGRDWISRPEHHAVHVILVDSGMLVSHAEVVWKTLDHAGQTYKAYGLSGVLTYPEYRGEGHGRRVVTAATAYIQASDGDVAILFCAPRLEHFYARNGWIPTAGSPTLVGSKDKPSVSDELRMMLFLSEKGKKARRAFELEPVYFDEDVTW